MGQLLEVVDRADGLQQGLGVGLGEGGGEVAPDLVLGEGQQDQGAVGVRPVLAALLAREVVLLVAQGAEVWERELLRIVEVEPAVG